VLVAQRAPGQVVYELLVREHQCAERLDVACPRALHQLSFSMFQQPQALARRHLFS
jgi:hypothetical protein